MNARQGLVLDANILLRAALGRRVRHILRKFEHQASFYTADLCFHDARKYVVEISEKKALDPGLGLSVLADMSQLVEQVHNELYAKFEAQARARIELRDPDDWPVIAVALLLDLPIWTEDQDFFGTGIPNWPPIASNSTSNNARPSTSHCLPCTPTFLGCYSSNFRRIIQIIRMGSPEQ